ncbi:hypothetical protein V6N13_020920 [Hibiscus sabdariffa]
MKLQQPLQESSGFDISDIVIEDYFLAPMVSPARPNLSQEPAPPVSLERPGLWQEPAPSVSLERPGLWQEPAPPVSLERPGLWQEPAPPVSLGRPGLWQEPTPPVCPGRPGLWREQQGKNILSKAGLIQRCPLCKEIGHGLHYCPYPALGVMAICSTRESPDNGLESSTTTRNIPMQSLWSTWTQPSHLSWTCFLLNRLSVFSVMLNF